VTGICPLLCRRRVATLCDAVSGTHAGSPAAMAIDSRTHATPVDATDRERTLSSNAVSLCCSQGYAALSEGTGARCAEDVAGKILRSANMHAPSESSCLTEESWLHWCFPSLGATLTPWAWEDTTSIGLKGAASQRVRHATLDAPVCSSGSRQIAA